MVKVSTVALIIGGLAAAGTAVVAVARPETFGNESKPKEETVKIGSDTQSSDPPFVIVSGGLDGSGLPGGNENADEPEDSTQDTGPAPGASGGSTVIVTETGTVDQGSGEAEGTFATPEETEEVVIKGRNVIVSSETLLPISAGTPIATGTEVLVDQLSKKTNERVSLVAKAAFEALGEDTKSTSIRGTTLAPRAIAKVEPTLAGFLSTFQGGTRRIRGSTALFEKLEANLKQTPEERQRLIEFSAAIQSGASKDGSGGSVVDGSSQQVLASSEAPDVGSQPLSGDTVEESSAISPLLSFFSKRSTVSNLSRARSRSR